VSVQLAKGSVFSNFIFSALIPAVRPMWVVLQGAKYEHLKVLV